MKNTRRYFSIITCLLIAIVVNAQSRQRGATVRTLIVFFDGLRPDYITPEAMPRLYAFKQKGAYGKQHHSVFPTVTRVNSASYSTGSYPATHGLMGNSVYFPEVNKIKSINTGDAEELQKIAVATHGKLLTAISLGEILQSLGKRMMVFSSGSTGQAFLQNHTISGGAIINPEMILPVSLKDSIYKDLGPVPENGKHKWVTDALLKYGISAGGPLVSAIWYSDPDGAAHSKGIGSPEAMASIKSVDAEFGRIIDELEKKRLTQSFNILISTDHGFVTYVGNTGLTDLLIKGGFKKSKDSDDVVVAGGALYVKDHDVAVIKKIVAALQPLEWIGAIFTKAAKPGDMMGSIEGTLSFNSIHWNHERAADILVDVNWDDQKNKAGYAGASYTQGVAGHGSISPYEVHIPLIVLGPAFKKAFVSDLPTSNVDLVPTVLHIHGITIPASMDGRVMNEMLLKPTANAMTAAKVEIINTAADYTGGSYQFSLERSVMGKYEYVNFARVVRKVKVGTTAKRRE